MKNGSFDVAFNLELHFFTEMFQGDIKCVGFDLDGTLYDEKEFIKQVYQPIAQFLSDISRKNQKQIYEYMLELWMEKGSSYSGIFQDSIDFSEIPVSKIAVSKCVEIYRCAPFSIRLGDSVLKLLDYCVERQFKLFIITDGNEKLQQRKIASLGVARYIEKENIVITGSMGKSFYKPSTAGLSKIGFVERYMPEQMVYIGDRDVDRDFSENAGIHFIKAKNMAGRLETRRIF
ncbi:MAG: HAD family hydrolase [Lachnospiraceae bacterium]|nr:HAD family hydrolase [Lachnospiraceae bacterium]MCC8154208.1 HAD family hydrolase [Tannerellaceae bacterium]